MIILIGDYTLHTTNRLLTGAPPRLRGGQTRILSAVMPESGTGIDYESGQSLKLSIQILDTRNECAEILTMGEYLFDDNQATLPGVPKRERENDLVEVPRAQPQTRWDDPRRLSPNAVHPPPLPPNMVGHPMQAMGHPFDPQNMYIAAPTPTMSECFLLSIVVVLY